LVVNGRFRTNRLRPRDVRQRGLQIRKVLGHEIGRWSPCIHTICPYLRRAVFHIVKGVVAGRGICCKSEGIVQRLQEPFSGT
jgi:hypothetical protein